jgi:MbtH protein
MTNEEGEDNTINKVVVNHEGEYSIWPAHRENALGWNDEGKEGTRAECLAHIKEVWTDIRVLSLRRKRHWRRLRTRIKWIHMRSRPAFAGNRLAGNAV